MTYLGFFEGTVAPSAFLQYTATYTTARHFTHIFSRGHASAKLSIVVFMELAHRLLFLTSRAFHCLRQVVIDKSFNKEILALEVKCSNNEWGCKWEGEYQQIQVRN